MAQRHHPKGAHTKNKAAEDATMDILREINRLIIKAHSENLVTVASLLEDARESIAWWAINDNHTDAEAEILARELKYSSALQIAAAFLTQLQTTRVMDPGMAKLVEECMFSGKGRAVRAHNA
jgi:hypothetical protein